MKPQTAFHKWKELGSCWSFDRSALPVSRVEKDPEKLKDAYEIGRQTALTRLEEIRNFLGCLLSGR